MSVISFILIITASTLINDSNSKFYLIETVGSGPKGYDYSKYRPIPESYVPHKYTVTIKEQYESYTTEYEEPTTSQPYEPSSKTESYGQSSTESYEPYPTEVYGETTTQPYEPSQTDSNEPYQTKKSYELPTNELYSKK